MPFVVDASVALAWALQEVHTTATLALQRIRNDEAIVPSLWWFELRNGLVINERRGRITMIETARFLGRIARVSIRVDLAPSETTVLDLARRHHLTVYDAAYLELAMREVLPIATLDVALVRAARDEAVAVVEGP
jgi:predicted nucleic acid-binding protein